MPGSRRAGLPSSSRRNEYVMNGISRAARTIAYAMRCVNEIRSLRPAAFTAPLSSLRRASSTSTAMPRKLVAVGMRQALLHVAGERSRRTAQRRHRRSRRNRGAGSGDGPVGRRARSRPRQHVRAHDESVGTRTAHAGEIDVEPLGRAFGLIVGNRLAVAPAGAAPALEVLVPPLSPHRCRPKALRRPHRLSSRCRSRRERHRPRRCRLRARGFASGRPMPWREPRRRPCRWLLRPAGRPRRQTRRACAAIRRWSLR